MKKSNLLVLAAGLLFILGGLVALRTWQYAGAGNDASDSADDALETLQETREETYGGEN
jgi:predicted negative regulator of RcsB-dependent stress response